MSAAGGERERLNRNRPSKNPGGMECFICGSIFIGDESHEFCAVCDDAVNNGGVPTLADAQQKLADLETENAALRAALEAAEAFIGVMFGVGPDAVVPEQLRTPIGIPVKARAIQDALITALNHARSERVIKGETKVTTIYIVYGWTAYESSDDICAFVNKSDAEAFAESLRVYDETRPLFVTKHEQGTGAHEKAFDRYWAKEQKWTKAHPAGCERNNWDIFELELRGPTP